jgi:HAD superfamily hydrolase (TIGR01509 family)
MQVAAVVLDMDGLMLDTEPIYKAAWQQASTELGYDLTDAAYVNVVGRDNADGERELVKQFGSGFPMAGFRARWSELWQARVNGEGIATKPGLFEFLAFVKERGLPVAVATSSHRDYTEQSLERAGLAGRFDAVVTGDQIAHGKPAPDIYLEAARQLGVAPSQCVALEDSDAGILAASRAGMVPLLIPDLRSPSAAAAAAAFRVLRSLHEARDLMATMVTTRSPGRPM